MANFKLNAGRKPKRPPEVIGWFGVNLKRLRTAAGLSQAALGRKAELTVSHISKMETGVPKYSNPTLQTLRRLARVLGCRPADLIAGE